MATLLQDLRYAMRGLSKTPAFTSIAVLALALGIGANTAMFSVVHAVLLDPLPFAEPSRLVKLWTRFAGIGLPDDRNAVSPPEYQDFLTARDAFDGIAIYQSGSLNLTSGGTPERVEGAFVSPSFFEVLGVKAQIGRTFVEEEGQAGKENVVVLGHGLWQRRFGGDRGVAGRYIDINGRKYLVAGVLPEGAEYPLSAEMWSVLVFQPQQLSGNFRGSHGWEVIARMKPGATLEQTRTAMNTLASRMIEQHREYPYDKFNFGIIVRPLMEEVVGDVRPAILILMGAVSFVLLIACANVANLLLARGTVRQRELAIRSALGARASRILRQLLVESVALSLAGAIAGLALAIWGVRVLAGIAEQTFPRIAAAAVNIPVLLFTLALSVITGVIFGMWPAVASLRAAGHESLKEGTRGSTSGAQLSFRKALVVLEVGLALVLLAGAGLLIRSFLNVSKVDAGIHADNVLTMRISLPSAKYSTPERITAFCNDLLSRLRQIPGVEAAGVTSALPLSGVAGSGTATIDTRAVPPEDASPEVDQRFISPGYFEAMGVELIEGRHFNDGDGPGRTPVAIVDETLARTYWPGESAIGKRIKQGGPQSVRPWLTIVGIVRHVRYRTLEAQSRAQLYWPIAQLPFNTMSVALRTQQNPGSIAAAAQRTVLSVDPEQPVYAVRTMNEWIARSLAQRRLLMLLLAVFGGLAVALAAVGIYGVLSFLVTQRSQEMGIRMALGAQPRDVLGMVIGQSLVLTGAGVAAGIAAALALTRLMANLLFNVKPADPLTYTLVAGGLVLIALTASFIPARRATLVDPIAALRNE